MTAVFAPSRASVALVIVSLASVLVATAMLADQFQSPGKQPSISAAPSAQAAARQEVLRYEEALGGPARDGGFVVQRGLKVGLAQVAGDEAANVMMQAVSWVEQLGRVRERFAAAATGLQQPELIAAAAAFDEALDGYQRAAETIGAAAIAAGEPRTSLLERAAASGRAADERYEEAIELLAAARRAVGLPATDGILRPAS